MTVLAAGAFGSTVTNAVGNLDWNNPAAWREVPFADNHYVLVPSGKNKPDEVPGSATVPDLLVGVSGPSTFGGNSLTLTAGSILQADLKNKSKFGSTLKGNLISEGGIIYFSSLPQGNTTALTATSFVLSKNLTRIYLNAGMDGVMFNGTLSGSGDLFVGSTSAEASYYKQVNFSRVENFTGSITVDKNVLLSFGNDHSFSGKIVLQGNGRLHVAANQTLTFEAGRLITSGTATPAGTYAASKLGSNFMGDGSIVVVPSAVVARTGKASDVKKSDVEKSNGVKPVALGMSGIGALLLLLIGGRLKGASA